MKKLFIFVCLFLLYSNTLYAEYKNCKKPNGKVYKSGISCGSNIEITEEEFLEIKNLKKYCKKNSGEVYISENCNNNKEISLTQFYEIKEKEEMKLNKIKIESEENKIVKMKDELSKPINEINLCLIDPSLSLSTNRSERGNYELNFRAIPSHIFLLCTSSQIDRNSSNKLKTNSKIDRNSRDKLKTNVRFDKITIKDICQRSNKLSRSRNGENGCPNGHVLKIEFQESNLHMLKKPSDFNDLALALGCGSKNKNIDDCVRRYLPSIIGTGPMNLEDIEEIKKDKEIIEEIVFVIKEIERQKDQSNNQEPSEEEKQQALAQENSTGQATWKYTSGGIGYWDYGNGFGWAPPNPIRDKIIQGLLVSQSTKNKLMIGSKGRTIFIPR